MSPTWKGAEPAALPPMTAAGWLRAALRGVPLLMLLALGLAVELPLRAVERSLLHPRRPLAPWVTVTVCQGALRLLGLRVRSVGTPMRGAGALLANHSSWLDILVLNAQAPVVFVAKSEVASWPGIGWLARATGTLFVRREARGEAAKQALALAERLRAGERLVLFPEGTSTDNRRVLPFKSALLSGLLAPGLPQGLAVQPVTLRYEAHGRQDTPFHAWYGAADFAPHALAVLGARRPGRVLVTFHPPIPVAGRDRKSLAAEAEALVRSAL